MMDANLLAKPAKNERASPPQVEKAHSLCLSVMSHATVAYILLIK